VSEVVRIIAVVGVVVYVGQAAIVMTHAIATRIPFAPEKDGTSFLDSVIINAGAARSRRQGPAQIRPAPPTYPHPGQPPDAGHYSPAAARPRVPSPGPPADRSSPSMPRPGGIDLGALLVAANDWLERRRNGR
jgi:hypothetical protein